MKQRSAWFHSVSSFVFGAFLTYIIAGLPVHADVATPCVPQLEQIASIHFNELLPDPIGDDAQEFIELRNDGATEISLAGWKIADAKNNVFVISDVRIAANASLSFLYPESKLRLTNTASSYTLTSQQGTSVDTVQYPSPVPQGKSYAFINSAWQWTSVLTPGAINAVDPPPAPAVASPVIVSPSTVELSLVPTFSALLPNPASNDADEWIEITNTVTSAIDLRGWSIVDASEKHAALDGITLAPGVSMRLPKNTTKISLNNDKEELRLLDPTGTTRDSVHYENAPPGSTYTKEGDVWKWSGESTSVAPMVSAVEATTPPPPTPQISEVRIAEIDMLDPGTEVAISGVVTLLPGVLGKTTFAVMDPDGSAATFVRIRGNGTAPILKEGDLVRITGKISSTPSINGAWKDVQVIGKVSAAKPEEKNPSEIAREDAGLKVHLLGTVAARGKRWLTVTDASAGHEVQVAFMRSEAPPANAGDAVTVTGVVRFKNDAPELIVTDRAAAKITSVSKETEVSQPAPQAQSTKSSLGQTLVLAAHAERPVVAYGALGMTVAIAGIGYFFWRRRRYA